MESDSKRDLHGEACCGWGHPRSGRHCRGSGDPRFVEMSASGGKVAEMIGGSVGDMANPRGVVLENVNWTVLAHEHWAIGGLHASVKASLLATVPGMVPPVA